MIGQREAKLKGNKMPLYEVSDGALVPFVRLKGGADLYESEIEKLLWENLEDFTGETLFPIARQPTIGSGGKPDIVALDESARVVVIEVKRDVDRSQLAQCLEYAGWARTASLDELAGMYHEGGPDQFFSDWQEFTDSDAPVVINPQPRLVLAARDLHGRTQSAMEFLIENKLPVTVVKVSVYQDSSGRRFVDVEGDFEPDLDGLGKGPSAQDSTTIGGKRISIADLLEHDLVQAGDELRWERPKKGETYSAIVEVNGAVKLDDGRVFASPSLAAMNAAELVAYNGWYAWTVVRLGKTLDRLRKELATSLQSS